MAPSGVQRERMRPQDMFVLDLKGNELVLPETRPPPYKPPKLSECSPLFMLVRLCLDVVAWIAAHFPPADCPTRCHVVTQDLSIA